MAVCGGIARMASISALSRLKNLQDALDARAASRALRHLAAGACVSLSVRVPLSATVVPLSLVERIGVDARRTAFVQESLHE